MSEMKTVEVEFNDEELLLDALKNMGYKPQVYNEGIEIDTYYKGRTKPKAHIVISKSQIGGYAAVGFERKKGGFRMHIDDMDKRKFGENKLKQHYSEAKLMKTIKGKSRYSVTSRVVKDNKIKVSLRVNFG